MKIQPGDSTGAESPVGLRRGALAGQDQEPAAERREPGGDVVVHRPAAGTPGPAPHHFAVEAVAVWHLRHAAQPAGVPPPPPFSTAALGPAATQTVRLT